jgi:hypothetical protein
VSEQASWVSIISALIALIALGVTSWVTWHNYWREGDLVLTRPALIVFLETPGLDGPKVYTAFTLNSTAPRGIMIESIYIRLTRHEAKQNFNVWWMGTDKQQRASGLFVGKEGVARNHAFTLSPGASSFEFTPGDYQVEIIAKRVGRTTARTLFSTSKLHVTEEQSTYLKAGTGKLMFNWGPDSESYLPWLMRGDEVRKTYFPAGVGDVLRIYLLSELINVVTAKDQKTEIKTVLRVINVAPFSVNPELIEATIFIDTVPAVTEIRPWKYNALEQGQHQDVTLAFTLDAVSGDLPSAIFISMSCEIVAMADGWEGRKSSKFEANVYGRVNDQRKPRA